MRYTLIVMAAMAVATAFVSRSPAQAEDWPWCVDYNGGGNGGGGTNCGFASWEQCQVTVRGVGGWCYPNPYYSARRGPPPRYRQRWD
jgi:hypothetical protein